MSSIYTKADNQIVIKVGDDFVIELEANPTTGYEWQLEFDSGMLTLLNQQFKPKSAGVGAGGMQHSRFRASTPGQTRIRAIYKRSWEANSLEEHTFIVNVGK
ncbi:MAG TPA: protease inhibitor I42 family protein [Pyrinomonadaceae bacterium]|nr:protease inhibitor I42 family protein [Pyrinomonadaceae bacterium]